jgi:tetratricopeptide (TPR) repeat protein
LNEAIRSYYRGDDEAAYEWFNKTIGLNANLEFAYAGIGKALVRQGDYNDAMKQFKRSMDQRNYSKAFLLYRKQVMREHFTLIMTTLAVLVIGWIVFRRYRKAVKRRGLTV